MKYTIFAAALCLLFASIAFAQTNEINIIPRPAQVERGKGSFVINAKTKIVAASPRFAPLAALLNEQIRQMLGFKLGSGKASNSKNVIAFAEPATAVVMPDGAYRLVVNDAMIGVQASSESGAFYGLQSLLQMIALSGKNSATVPAATIHDQPRFGYRGMHLDVSRHFFPVEFVKKYIDLMSQYKFNTFHWHLTDDQGWRIEIKKYPKLTEIGSKRPESVKERNLNPYIGDGVPVEGFYTQEQIKDVIAYAKARYITVIPEIELPGHSSAALAAYPELGCKADYKYKVQTTWGIFKEVYCPTEKTFQFLEDVLSETIALFPDSPYIHVGGDEVLKDMWKESPEVKELMARENLKDVNEVQSYFVRRMEKFINSKGKKIIGWDEILEGGLAPNATVMSWRGIKGGIAAAKEHHDVIMTPTDFCYFDYGQGDPATEPLNIGGFLPLDKVYGWEPVPKELSADEAKYILGGQGNIWTEYLATPERVEYMAFPRVIALSEVLWSTPENKNFADFSRRLGANLPRLDKQNVNYRMPEPIGLTNRVLAAGDKATIDLASSIPGSRILYTIDGTAPDEKSTQYTKPLEIDVPPGGRVDVKTIIVLPSGRKSSVYTATLVRRDMLTGVEVPEKRAGVTYGIVSWRADGVPEPFVTSGETKSIGLQQFAKTAALKEPFAVTFNGYFVAPSDGIYEFQAESTYSAAVEVGGVMLFNDTGAADRKIRSAVIPLKAGTHKISLRYSNRGGDPFFRVRWAFKGQQWRNIGGGELVH